MFETFLKPIMPKDSYAKDVEKLIEFEFFFNLYKPLLDILKGVDTRESAKVDPVIIALKSGKIFYADGFMYGKFSAVISKRLTELGGKFNKTKKGVNIELSKLTPEIRSAIADKKNKIESMLKEIDKKIIEAKDKVPVLEFKPFTDKVIKDLHIQFAKVTPESLQVPFEINDYTRKRIEEEYTANMNITIQEYHGKEVQRLRELVEKNVSEGFRADKLIAVIQSGREMTKKKARYIARQESSLLVSKYRQIRYEEAGVSQYRWSTSQDERVRKEHKDLNNRIFSWDNPPIVDKASGRKAHPGEDFGCRCVALPVIKGILND